MTVSVGLLPLPVPQHRGGWYMGGLAVDGCIYCAPADTGPVLRINPDKSWVSREDSTEHFGGVWAGSYVQAVRAPDGRMYCIPHQASHVVRINPTDLTAESFGEACADMSWDGAVAGNDACIYCIPRNGRFGVRVMRVDTTNGTTDLIGTAFEGSDLWMGGVRAHDGRIYCTPANASRFLCIDPNDGTTKLVGDDLGAGGFKWWGGVLAKDGWIYCSPRNASRVLRFHPISGTTELIGAEYQGLNKWVGGVLGPDAEIYCFPADASRVLRINPASATTELIGETYYGRYKWCNGVLAHDGSIYAVPTNAPHVLRLSPPVPKGWVHEYLEPWTSAKHRTFPIPIRQRAYSLVCIGFQLAYSGAFPHQENALMSIWHTMIMPKAMCRTSF